MITTSPFFAGAPGDTSRLSACRITPVRPSRANTPGSKTKMAIGTGGPLTPLLLTTTLAIAARSVQICAICGLLFRFYRTAIRSRLTLPSPFL